jgi:hypothetical protein
MYGKLSHSNLEEQLKPYVCDKTKGEIVRRVAIYIAEACRLQSLQDELANIALDITQSIHIRAIAAHALCSVGDDKTKSKLRPWSEPLRVDNELSNINSWRELYEKDEATLRPSIQDISSS